MQKKYKVCIIGDGGWGTALSLLLCRKGFSVSLWGAFAEYISFLNANRENKKFLPGFKIPDAVIITSDIASSVDGADVVIIAVPSRFMRGLLRSQAKRCKIPPSAIIVSATKGIEAKSFKRPSEIIQEELGTDSIVVISGPTIAHEVAEGLPSSAVVASRKAHLAQKAQEIFMTGRFRIYTSPDPVGVELGGALKNIIAIAAGISDGLGFGTNAKASLFTRGLVEMKRLGVALGAQQQETFEGLSGMGDLLTTCTSQYSRNRHVGEEVAKGRPLPDILNTMAMIAEGVDTTKAVYHLSRRMGIEAPITAEVYKVLFNKKGPLAAVGDLMTRQKKAEFIGRNRLRMQSNKKGGRR